MIMQEFSALKTRLIARNGQEKIKLLISRIRATKYANGAKHLKKLKLEAGIGTKRKSKDVTTAQEQPMSMAELIQQKTICVWMIWIVVWEKPVPAMMIALIVFV